MTSGSGGVKISCQTANKKNFSDTLEVQIENLKEGESVDFSVNLTQKTEKNPATKEDKGKQCYSKHNLDLVPFRIKKQDGNIILEEVLDDERLKQRETLKNFLNSQMKLINELTASLQKMELFPELAYFRKGQMLNLFLHLFYNRVFINCGDKDKQIELLKGILEEYRLLGKNKSLRMNIMYQSFYDDCSKQLKELNA